MAFEIIAACCSMTDEAASDARPIQICETGSDWKSCAAYSHPIQT